MAHVTMFYNPSVMLMDWKLNDIAVVLCNGHDCEAK